MGDVSRAIDDFITTDIQLSKPDIEMSAKSRKWFLDRIESVVAQRQNEPTLYAPKKFLNFGSYFKGTKVKVVDEYDVLVIIDSNKGQFSMGNTVIGKGLGSADPNNKYTARFMKTDGSGISPAKILNWLQGVAQEVTDAFEGEAPEREGQAVTATIKSKNIAIDLVPAGIFQRMVDNTCFYNIPKGDQAGNWIVTSPEFDMQLLSNVASDRPNLKNVIRILKYIRDSYNMKVGYFAL